MISYLSVKTKSYVALSKYVSESSTKRYQTVQWNARTTTLSREETRSVGIQRVNSGLNRDKSQKF